MQSHTDTRIPSAPQAAWCARLTDDVTTRAPVLPRHTSCQEGRILGGLGSVPGFGWWPIKAYRPCPNLGQAGIEYTR